MRYIAIVVLALMMVMPIAPAALAHNVYASRDENYCGWGTQTSKVINFHYSKVVYNGRQVRINSSTVWRGYNHYTSNPHDGWWTGYTFHSRDYHKCYG